MNTLSRPESNFASRRIWLASYPASVPAELPPLDHESLPELFDENCVTYASRKAFTSMGRSMTFQELGEQATKIAAWLQAEGFSKGDRIAVMMPNVLQNPVIVFGILKAGMIVVNVNPLYTPRELAHQLKDSGAVAIFVLENFAHTVQAVMDKVSLRHVVVTSMGDMLGLKGHLVNFIVRKVKKLVPAWSIANSRSFASVLAAGGKARLRPETLSRNDIAFLQYTGGTTGVSKGAVLTHGNLIANTMQMSLWLGSAFDTRPRPETLTFICALPLYHIFALTVNALMGIASGGHNILIANPRDIPGFAKELSRHDFNIIIGLNTLFNALMNNEAFRKLDFSHLQLTFAGGMSVQRPIAERWHQITGCPITEGYGLSETSPVATANRMNDKDFSGCIGMPISSTDVDIRDEQGESLALGEVGEICIRGPQVMAGYWQRPEETARAMTEDGFFRTGDMGFMDARGYTKIVDRKKDMILVSGFNVYPNEIEEVAVMHPGVLEAAAIGVPDPHSGEAVKLFVVRKDPSLTEQQIKDHCATNLTNYKRPRHVAFLEELPKSNVGKILRKDLRP
ncbi:long-chain-fatty-acid--CoA ligase [Agrobacterium vitis]|uniref:Long-chain-fatty-acid--CoA ligase n=1 Tax=Agrobacterium vitis TaxID=373 RepID=A0ABD6G601_AGRVI|nr:long-chain fatty acid--CoA ligase [Agrobacterium vitis]MUO79974.1 long-chain-fatty-acid--CoA ligase [Agrobacterium vitis]MUO93537.1 long-chain-fatty-acid--CoA ligase [Agrobacterium vitis]MUP04212.1 long-chain-fatty-acid--CoA ligase [Agrobacterium vitis]MUZ84304.1 long-chain-fatty-acid--CoA ligase [Agrobacterium vitis]MVA11135.1 long-chain-fatty-acid--CoA ligase [Agrobacterium vitis]